MMKVEGARRCRYEKNGKFLKKDSIRILSEDQNEKNSLDTNIHTSMPLLQYLPVQLERPVRVLGYSPVVRPRVHFHS